MRTRSQWTWAAFVIVFAGVAIVGSWHGFPLVDVFADETYLVFAPLTALKTGNLLPQHLPYGTFTYLLMLPLQAAAMGIAWIIAGMHHLSLEHVIMQWPFVAYIAPRALNAGLYVMIAVVTMRSLKLGKPDERPYAKPLLLIFLLNATILLVAHSGKMWMTCLSLIFLAGMSLPASPLLAVLCASLALANLPIMGAFWLITLICAVWLQRRERRAIIGMLLIAVMVPATIMLLNVDGIVFQVHDIFKHFQGVETGGARGLPEMVMGMWRFVALHAWTGVTFLEGLASTGPFCLLALPLLWRARCINLPRFVYALTGGVLYLLGLAFVFGPQNEDGGSIRYIAPLATTLAVLITCFELRRSRIRTLGLSILAALSVYTGAVFLINLAMPTTCNRASAVLEAQAGNDTVIFSAVQEISFPYTALSARLTRQWLPDHCSTRCQYAIGHPEESPDAPNYLLVNDPKLRAAIKESLHGIRIIDVTAQPIDDVYVTVENGAGEMHRPAAWWPFGFGRPIRITGNGIDLTIP